MHRWTGISLPEAATSCASAKKSNSGGDDVSKKIDSMVSERRLSAANSGSEISCDGSGSGDSLAAPAQQVLVLPPLTSFESENAVRVSILTESINTNTCIYTKLRRYAASREFGQRLINVGVYVLRLLD